MPDDRTLLLDTLRRAALTPADPMRLDQIDREMLAITCPAFDRLCRTWFDLRIEGTGHLPRGATLIVGNHNSGITFLEALGVGANAWVQGWGHMDDTPWHGLAHDAMCDLPMVGPFLIRSGAIRASHEMADAAFAAGRKIMVFPGGNLEAFRPWTERHRIKFGGHKGFARLALRHQVPITPHVYLGGQSAFFVLRDNQDLARWIGAKRLFRTDTFPLFVGMPWGLAFGPLFHLPAPIPVDVRFLEPVDVSTFGGPQAADDRDTVQAVYDEVTTRMQAAMDEMVAQARPPSTVLRRWWRAGRRRLGRP